MKFTPLDLAIVIVFFTVVLGFSLLKSRGRKDCAGYFLGGRRLPWWLIGVSIVAANLSTEQFVGMAGQAAGPIGLTVSAWQLTGSVGVVIVAWVFLPRFLSAGIYTMPEYLEYRYNALARGIMSVLTILIYASVTTAAVLYSGATALETIFGIRLELAIALIALLGVLYLLWGGLLAAVWADLFQGTALLLSGLITVALGIHACDGWTAFATANADRLHMIQPANHPELPWTVLLSGMWIPIFYYCGLNQFITQRALAAGSLRQGQLGVLFAGALWLLVPWAIVLPGVVAHQLYGTRLDRPDQAYPTLIRELIPDGLRGFILAALAGAVISSLASMLNSASTLFTLDLWKRHWRRDASETELVVVGRASTVAFLFLACFVALSNLLKGGVFRFIQEFQGYISPGILAAFVFGFAVRRAPPAAGVAALVASAPLYGLLQYGWGHIPYLHRMSLTFLLLLGLMGLITWAAPLATPRELPRRPGFDMSTSPLVTWAGIALIAAVLVFFLVFW